VSIAAVVASGFLPGTGSGEVVVLVQDRLDVRIVPAGGHVAGCGRRLGAGLVAAGFVAGGLLPGRGGVGGQSCFDVAVIVRRVGVGGGDASWVALAVAAAGPLLPGGWPVGGRGSCLRGGVGESSSGALASPRRLLGSRTQERTEFIGPRRPGIDSSTG
jgi:hypothetical protein